MAQAKQRTEWARTAMLLTMLEACRQVDVPIDGQRWMPPALRDIEQKPRVTKEKVAEFCTAVRAGADVRGG